MQKDKVLIVVDMQNDFISGILGNKESQEIVPNVVQKIKEYELNNNRIYYTYDTHEENYLNTHEGLHLPITHCIKNTKGWQLYPDIQEHKDKYAFAYGMIKYGFGFNWSGYKWMNDADIEIVGVMTDICVITNALIIRGLFPEADITVDSSCCAGTTIISHNAALMIMEKNHITIKGEIIL